MSADRTAPADSGRDTVEDGEDDEAYYLVSPTPTTKKRHRPDETGGEPACRAFLQREDAGWRTLSSRQTVLYDDCRNCFLDE